MGGWRTIKSFQTGCAPPAILPLVRTQKSQWAENLKCAPTNHKTFLTSQDAQEVMPVIESHSVIAESDALALTLLMLPW